MESADQKKRGKHLFKDDGDGLYEEVIKKIISFFLLLVTVFISFLTITAIYLGGFSFVILGIGGIIFFISLSFICWTPYKAKKFLIPLAIGLTPLYILLPGKGTYNPVAPLEYRTVFESNSQWFSGTSEHDLVHMGEKWGYSENERKRLGPKGGLAAEYDDIQKANLFQYNSSVVLDSWFFDRGHYWFYRPSSKNRPLLIFLHGSGGSFKAYQHWFIPYAKKHNIALAFPTWGLGTWDTKKLGDRINDVIRDIEKGYSIDQSQIFICGLSQGSLTGVKTITEGLVKPKGFISVSGIPYLSTNELKSLAEYPIYILHGAKDERVNLNNTKSVVGKLRNFKADVHYSEFSDQDHTLIKVKTDKVLSLIFNWILNGTNHK